MSPLNLVKSWFSRIEPAAASDHFLNRSWTIVCAIQMIFHRKCGQTVLMNAAVVKLNEILKSYVGL